MRFRCGLNISQEDRACWGLMHVHPLGQLGGAVSLLPGRVSFHSENLVPTCGSQCACVGSSLRLWGEAERTRLALPRELGAWAQHMPSEPPVPACEK